MDTTDKSLLDAHLNGDASAFTELVRRHGPAMLGYLTKISNDRHRAEDHLQETFKRVHEKAASFRGGSFKSWLFTIATRVAFDSYRKNKKLNFISLNRKIDNNSESRDLSGVTMAENYYDPQRQAQLTERKQQVRDALGKLPQKQRATVVLAYYEQLSYAQVAQALNCSVGTVKTQMFRALKTLAKHLPDTAGGVK